TEGDVMGFSYEEMRKYAANPLNRPSFVHPFQAGVIENCERAESKLREVRWHPFGSPGARDEEALDNALYAVWQAMLVVEALRKRIKENNDA
ncbi:MAG: hypothetical protein ACK5QX_09105, partial [bacterium]